MRLRLLLSFLLGAVVFTVLPIYAPFILLQTDQTPRFLLGLGAGVVAGAVLVLGAGTVRRGLLLVLACAFVGGSLYVLVYLIPTMGPMDYEGGLVLATASTYAVLMPFAFLYLVLPGTVGVALIVLARSLLARSRRSGRS
jgi:hypothetical protein